MMVLFISQGERGAIKTTRNILDMFANRIGNDVWKTVITEAGLEAVHTALKRNATKNMSVACHYIRSRKKIELLWIVGNRSKFNNKGEIPVNTTQKDILHNEWEQGWKYMPQ